jgi:prepilin-type N-terminal cleavage/methylation domain-containing protein
MSVSVAAAPTRSNAPRRGMALMEVLIALVVLALSGTALITLLGQTAHTVRTLHRSEQLVRLASAELERMVVWDRREFAAHVGRSTFRGWSLQIDERAAALFDVAIAESDTGIVLLRTTMYRPDSIRATEP